MTEAAATEIVEAVLVHATFPSATVAERVGGALVERGLAACVNILPGMISIYVWEGRSDRGSVAVTIIKTRAGLAERVIADVKAMHPYHTRRWLFCPS